MVDLCVDPSGPGASASRRTARGRAANPARPPTRKNSDTTVIWLGTRRVAGGRARRLPGPELEARLREAVAPHGGARWSTSSGQAHHAEGCGGSHKPRCTGQGMRRWICIHGPSARGARRADDARPSRRHPVGGQRKPVGTIAFLVRSSFGPVFWPTGCSMRRGSTHRTNGDLMYPDDQLTCQSVRVRRGARVSTPRRAAGKPGRRQPTAFPILRTRRSATSWCTLTSAPGDPHRRGSARRRTRALGRTPGARGDQAAGLPEDLWSYTRAAGSYAAQVDVSDLASLCDISGAVGGPGRRAKPPARARLRGASGAARAARRNSNVTARPSRLLEPRHPPAHRAVHRLSHKRIPLRHPSPRPWICRCGSGTWPRERLPHLEHHVHGQVGILAGNPRSGSGEGPANSPNANVRRVRGRGQGDVLV